MKNFQLLFLPILLLLSVQLVSSQEAERFTHKSETFRSDFDSNVTIMEGDVVVESQLRKLTADKMEIQGKSGVIVATGNVHYTQGSLRAEGEKAHMNMRTGLGYFENAILRLGESLYLEGKKIERVEEERFRIEDGKVSTCQDCPQSWSVTGSLITVRVEGYAEVHHAIVQIKDTTIAYIPLLVFPVKTKRQSGILPPNFRIERELGFQAGVPYFGVISEDADTTVELQSMTNGGNRIVNEFRYVYSPRSYVQGKYSLLKNNSVSEVPSKRWGSSFAQRAQLNRYFVQRYAGEVASDSRYTRHFEKDFEQNRLTNLSQELSLAYQDFHSIAVVRSKFHDDNIPRKFNYDLATGGKETRALHAIPDAEYRFPSYRLFKPFRFDFGSRYLRLERPKREAGVKVGGTIDPDTGFIRTGERGTLEATLKAPFRLGSFVYRPTVQTRFDGYNFSDEVKDRSTWRLRTYFEQQAEADIFRVYKVDNGTTLKAIKHSITPNLRWSYSPYDARERHDFWGQKDAFDQGSPKFDLFDPGSDVGTADTGTVSEEQRLTHHHFITAGISTRVVGRYGEESRSYFEHFGASITQDYNFLADDLADAFGLMGLNAFGAYKAWKLSTAMTIDVRKNWNAIMTNRLEYSPARFSLYAFQVISPGAPSLGGGGELKSWGPFSFRAEAAFDLKLNIWQRQTYGTVYRSPSKCWVFELLAGREAGAEKFDISPSLTPTFYELNVSYIPGS